MQQCTNEQNDNAYNKPIIQAAQMRRVKNKFTMSEDAALQMLVKKYGDADWSAIANALRTKNSRQCHDRWFYYLSPKLNRNPFTEEEDNKLIQLEKKYGQHWVKIAKHFSGRTDTQIKNRWNVIKRRLENDRPLMTTTYINQTENPFDYNPQQLFWDAQNLFQFSQMAAQF